MKLPIDWSSAPEGATHYSEHPYVTHKWLKYSPLSFYNEALDEWVKYTNDNGATHLSESVEKPDEDWDCVGLPPVGTICEYKKKAKYRALWTKVKILYIGENVAVMSLGSNGNEFTELLSECTFRAIKTPKQVAVSEMNEVIKEFNTYHEVCEALYDAGYRKVDMNDEIK